MDPKRRLALKGIESLTWAAPTSSSRSPVAEPTGKPLEIPLDRIHRTE